MAKKNPFDDIEEEGYQDKIASMSTDEIKFELSQISINQMELMEAKEQDQDLADKKEAYSEAGAVYRDRTKQNKLKAAYCKQVLGDKGGC